MKYFNSGYLNTKYLILSFSVVLFIYLLYKLDCYNYNPAIELFTTTIPNTKQPINSKLAVEYADSTSKIISTLTDETDPRFIMDPVKRDELLRAIKAELEFDPSKTDLDRDVIYEIYNKYFDTNVFKKMLEINDDSKKYIKSGNFAYLPKSKITDFDLQKYQDLQQNTAVGVN